MIDTNDTRQDGLSANEKKAARLAAYLEEYGAEEAELRQDLQYTTWISFGACVTCGIVMAIPWHPVIAFVIGIGCWTGPREPLRKRRKAAEDRRRFYGLD